jgi:hypothetical protein
MRWLPCLPLLAACRETEGHGYDRVERDRLGGFWTVRQTTLVVRTAGDSAIAWIKLPE